MKITSTETIAKEEMDEKTEAELFKADPQDPEKVIAENTKEEVKYDGSENI